MSTKKQESLLTRSHSLKSTTRLSRWPIHAASETRHIKQGLQKTPNKEIVLKAIVKIVETFGLPKVILSDGGPEFDNQLIRDLLNYFSIEQGINRHHLTYSYATVERVSKTLHDFMRESPCIMRNFNRSEREQWMVQPEW